MSTKGPLDKRIVIQKEEHGKTQEIPALDPKWKEDRHFVVYQLLPIDASNTAAIEEWLERVDFIEEDLKWLLSLSHERFWCQVIFDESLGKCIDSCLKHAPRGFEAGSIMTYSTEVKDKLESLNRLLFMTCVRMATYKESKEDCITPEVFGEILYENFIFDIPKILDMCALYGQSNSKLLTKMISNIFTQQPKYTEDLQQTLPTVCQVFFDIGTKCGLQDKTGTPQKLTNRKDVASLKALSNEELGDIINYVMDIAVTLSTFVEVYPPACQVFLQDSLLNIITSFYNGTLQEISDEVKKRRKELGKQRLALKRGVYLAKTHLVKMSRLIIQICFLNVFIENSQSENIAEKIEEYMEVLSAFLEDKRFLADYEEKYPFGDDLDVFSQMPYKVDGTRLQFLQEGIQSAYNLYRKQIKTKPVIEAPSETIRKDESSEASDGWACSVEASDGWACSVAVSDAASVDVPYIDEPLEGATASPQITGIELESLISSVKDLLPDLGDGFIELCLEEMNYSAEKVINAVLEDKLSPSLVDIDKTLAQTNAVLEDKLPPSLVDIDKTMAQTNTTGQEPVVEESVRLTQQRQNVFDNDEFDIMRRDQIDLSKIHRGKKNTIGDKKLFFDDKKVKDEIKSRMKGLDLIEDTMYESGMYDDEYDDTYDENLVGADDVDSADELTTRRSFTIPRILRKGKEDGMNPSRYIDEGSESEDDMKVKKRDEFVQNPAEIRERKAARLASQRGQNHVNQRPIKSHDVKGQPKGQGQGQESQVVKNRTFKEKNKGNRANHNRRDMAARKMNKGMF